MNIERVIETDVLIVGGGAAALRAAVGAGELGAKVTVALKGKTGKVGASVSLDSPAVAWQCADGCSADSGDSPEVHFHEIVSTGLGMADPRLARIQAYEIVERTRELERWGVQFVKDPSGRKAHFTAHSCFAHHHRAHSVRDTGRGHAGDIVWTMIDRSKQYDIDVHQDVFITDLLVEDGACVGAMGLDPDGRPVMYRSGAVMFGAGGARQIFPPTAVTQIDTTGDGYAMALRAGAELTNMEFIQYMVLPSGFSMFDVPGMYWSAFPKLRNRHGEEVLSRYLPEGVSVEQAMRDRCQHMPFSIRDASGWIDIAVVKEENAGRGAPEGGLYLDFSECDLENYEPVIQHHFDEGKMERKAIRPSANARVVSTAHASNGGILINEQAEASLPGLFAAGEVCTGPHGADRLGGGMVSMGIVFGARAGKYAAERARQTDRTPLKESTMAPALARLHAGGQGKYAEGLFSRLQEFMGRDFLNVKSGPGCEKLLGDIQELREEWLPNLIRKDLPTVRRAIEAENSLKVAELMVRAAHAREESRGNHFREDFPEMNEGSWRKNVIFTEKNGELNLSTRNLEGAEPAQI
jgi:L-aspartate oxidase